MKIKLICDSMCDIPEEIVNKEFVEMIPLTINIDGKEYKDGVDFTKEQFYDILKKCDNLPKTSQVTYVDFKNIFEKYKTYLSKNEINYFINLLNLYENRKIPFSSVIVAIQIYAIRFDDKDLLNQTFFNPYPIELISIADSGKGRNL